MADIRVNDMFEELIEENVKITECLNVLIRFKTFVDLIVIKLKTNLESNYSDLFDEFHTEVEDVFKRNQIEFSVKNPKKQTKLQIIESLSSKPQTTHENSLHLSSKELIKSIKVKSNGGKPRLLSKRKTSTSNGLRESEEKEILIDENQRYVCSFIGCGQRLKNRATLRNHERLHTTPKAFECHFDGCSFATRYRAKLRDHINAHKGIKPFICEFCDKRFSAEKYLKQHIEIMHKVSDQILICGLEECTKEFLTELSLKNHQNYCHLKEKRFVCEEPNCVFRTITNSRLNKHFQVVHSKLRPFPCPLEGCSKTYKDNTELNRHIEGHSSERKFKCSAEDCDRAYKTSSDLRKHQLKHTGVVISCDWPGCDYTSYNSSRLRSHQMHMHSTERHFACNWPQCGKQFKTRIQLNTHQRIHKNDKRYACSWPGCQYRCTDSGNMIKHRRVHMKT